MSSLQLLIISIYIVFLYASLLNDTPYRASAGGGGQRAGTRMGEASPTSTSAGPATNPVGAMAPAPAARQTERPGCHRRGFAEQGQGVRGAAWTDGPATAEALLREGALWSTSSALPDQLLGRAATAMTIRAAWGASTGVRSLLSQARRACSKRLFWQDRSTPHCTAFSGDSALLGSEPTATDVARA